MRSRVCVCGCDGGTSGPLQYSMARARDDDFDLPPGIDAGPSDESTLPRCWPSIDCIETAGGRATHVCIHWANGTCTKGVHCTLRHGLPTQVDEDRLFHAADSDIFGRTRHALNMATSLFDPLQCQTLHIISGMPRGSQQERRRELESALAEWGTVTRIWFVSDQRAAFVRFKWRSTAQLVLEALRGRPLRPDMAETLELGWCTVDPSALQQEQGKELAYSAMLEARQRQESTQALYENLERENAKRSIGDGAPSRLGKRPRADALHPYEANPSAKVSAQRCEEEVEVTPVAAGYPDGELRAGEFGPEGANDAPSGTQGAAVSRGMAGGGAASLPTGWESGVDPCSGFTYFYNTALGKTQWQLPDAEESRNM